MNKYWLLSTAMILASASAAQAATKVTTLCDNGSPFIRISNTGEIYNAQYLDDQGEIGLGISGKSKGFGKHVLISESSNNYNDPDMAYATDLSLPLRNGGSWNLWVEFSGTTAIDGDSGSYTICNGAAVKPGGASIMARTQKLIRQLRAERHAASKSN